VRLLLGNHLEGIAQAHGDEPAIEKGESDRADCGDGHLFQQCGGDQAAEGAGGELGEGQRGRCRPGREPGDIQDMGGPQEGAGELEQVSPGDGERLVDAEQIEPRHGNEHTQPGTGRRFPAPERVAERHDYHVEARDEACFAGSGIPQALLLEPGGRKEDQAGDDAAVPGVESCAGTSAAGEWEGFSAEEEGNEHQGPQAEAEGIEGEGSHVLHGDPLPCEGEAPDESGGKEQAVVGERLSVLHVLSCFPDNGT